MSMSRLRRAPERWWNSFKMRRNNRTSSKSSRSDRDSTGSLEGSGRPPPDQTDCRTTDIMEICGEHYLKGIRRSDSLEGEQSTTGVGPKPPAPPDEQILSEAERREVLALVQDNNISMDFILEMKEAFLLFDKNGDGFISARELGVLMRTLGRNPTEEEIMNIMNEIDVDHNGKLDFSEFVIMMRDKLSGEDMEQEIRQAFRVFDRNGDGYISKQEFKHCMMHFGERFTNEEVEEMIAEADSNNDGKIDYHEFSKMILSEIT